MVSDVVHLDTTISQRIKHGDEEREDEDTISVSTASTDNCDGAVVLHDAEDKAPCFQNIEVTNSSDVHFGNKTYYQGPVTIKQILYTNRDGENKLPETNDIYHEQPQLAINEKVEGGLNYASYNDGYTTDGVHHINGHGKLPNGINHDHFETIRGSGEKKLSNNQWLLVGGAIFAVILLIITAVALALSLKGSSSSVSQILVDDDELELDESSLPGGLHMISRAEWKAKPYKGEYTALKKPVTYIIIHQTSTIRCFNQDACKTQAVNIQDYHMRHYKFNDIAYNFIIGGDGYVYEGRGWDYAGTHAIGYNNISIGIAFIGSFTKFLPESHQLDQAQFLIAEGIKKKYICNDYNLVGLNHINAFESPGRLLIEEIKNWPHFFVFNTTVHQPENTCVSLPLNLSIISRVEWGAKRNIGEYTLLKTPVEYVIIHHTRGGSCFNSTICQIKLKAIQDFHMNFFGWDDIAYNFMIGGDGHVYEARGWDYVGTHTIGYNNISIGIAFIGTFKHYLPEQSQIELGHLLIKEGVRNGHIHKDYRLIGMNQVTSLDSPGKLLIQEIKTWPHFFDFRNETQSRKKQIQLSPNLHMISRNEWGARKNVGKYTLLKTPVPFVIIHHTETNRCFYRTACILQAKSIQAYYMESFGWDDIAYNFMIGGDGYVYEGRGWDYMGAHALGYNNISIGIGFIGTFIKFVPEPSQIEQAHILIEDGVKNGYISEDYKLVGMSQVTGNESPATLLIKEIKTWPHFYEFQSESDD
ncbi:uncharacterized protein [Onthophagus taurus]|uniref:uncharacterized protein isoform X1 n=1 Tax=Onthophagus taurus TaxID=166361 RepID=UPI0039BE48DA